MATFYLDLVNGNDASAGTSWATAWKTFTNGATAARIAPGDEIRVAKSSDPVSIGNATWTSQSATLTLATAKTATIDNCETAWTAANGSNVTRSTAGGPKQGTYYAAITTPAATTTSTKYAYFAVGGASGLDLSAYQQITFWIQNIGTAIADANSYQIKLCSDTTGDTAVDTFNVIAIPSIANWVPLVLTKVGGGNLGSAIKSIALYTGTTSPGNTRLIYLDNFSACTTNGLNLQSLISKNSTADFTMSEGWWNIQSISGTTLRISGQNSFTEASSYRGYYTDGTSPETVTTYIRSTIKTSMAAASNTSVETIQDTGTAGNYITFTGGWDTVSNTRTSMTFMDGVNNLGYCLVNNGKNYIKLEYFGFARYQAGIQSNVATTGSIYQKLHGVVANDAIIRDTIASTASNINNIYSVSGSALNISGLTYSTIDTITAIGSFSAGITCGTIYSNLSNLISNYTFNQGIVLITSNYNTFTNLTAKYGGNYGLQITGGNNIYYNITANNNVTAGVNIGGTKNYYYNLSTTGNASNSILVSGYANIINNYTYGESVPILWQTGGVALKEQGLDFINGSPIGATYLNATGTSTSSFSAIQQSVTTKTGTGYAWQCNVLSTIHTATVPAKLTVSKIAVNANKLVTVKAWVKLSHASNISAALVAPKLNIQGVSSDIIANKTADTNWEELTVTFTPTVTGVATIELWTWSTTGSTTNSSYIDSMTITQA